MRILLISDIHANYPALAAINEPYDACLCLGDLVEYGPHPREVVAWVRRHATHCVRGNHDHGTAQNVDVHGVGGFRYLTMATRTATMQMLPANDRKYLASLPTLHHVTLAGKTFALVHATPRDPLDEYVPPDAAQWATRLAGLQVDYLCVGHTHQPFHCQVGRTTILNPGAVGLQRDGNPQARYAILDNGVLTMHAIDYPIHETLDAVSRMPIDERAKRMLGEVYCYGRLTPPGVVPSLAHAPEAARASA